MDSFYEESVVNQKEKQQRVFYLIFHVIEIISIVAAVVWALFTWPYLPMPSAGTAGDWIFFIMVILSFSSVAVASGLLKRRFNVTYDYVCVSGELRISKVINQRKRKLICLLDPDSILQLGDMESASYDRLRSMPGVKETACTPNLTAASGKFFMYVYAQHQGIKKLYLLECREELLVNMMQYLRRDVLDRDYVPQAKKL